ncbi:MAG: hypothetical protein M3R36_04945 [Bacteroidota bacterium]|nr:hypothetical protein [Bacteroidota bacterium]
MYYRRVLSAIMFLSVSVVYYRCDTVINPTSTVSGKVRSYEYLNVSNVKVTIGNNSVYTASDGSFSMDNFTYPYDVIVSDSLHKFATVFKGLSANNIVLPVVTFSSNNYFFINVNFPYEFIHSELSGKIMFTDGNHVNSYADIDFLNPEYPTRLYVPSNEAVTGKIILLSYRTNSEGEIISYENFGESPAMQLQPGNSYNYEFDSQSIQFNPGEQNVSGSVSAPDGYNSYSYFYLNFSTINATYGEVTIGIPPYRFSYLGEKDFNFIIPTGLARNFKTIVETLSFGAAEGYSREEFYVYHDAANNLETHTYASLVSPQNSAVNVNTGTLFSFDGGSGTGVYVANIYVRNLFNEYHIVTSNNSFTLEGLEEIGIGSLKNSDLYWNVTKVGPVTSVNDYVTTFFNQPNHFISKSNDRLFSTEP